MAQTILIKGLDGFGAFYTVLHREIFLAIMESPLGLDIPIWYGLSDTATKP